MSTDDRDQNLTRADSVLDDLNEIFARLNVVYIHEDLFVAEVRAKAVEQAAGVARAIVAAIRDEDSGELFGGGLRHTSTTLRKHCAFVGMRALRVKDAAPY